MPTHSAIDVPASGPNAVGLILTGGGARAAYQVGVLSAVMDILDPHRTGHMPNPFPIICGTSAGAINAAALACRAHDPHTAADRLVHLWSDLRTGDVYHGDALRLIRTGIRWLSLLSLGWMAPGLRERSPRSLLDNSPLRGLLSEALDFDRLAVNLNAGDLTALAVTASTYTTGEHLTFYQSRKQIQPWRRALRHAEPTLIGVDHLLASSAIPFVFPAQALRVRNGVHWCGDGSMRQLAPISPAIHLGAQKIFVIGTGFRDETHPEEGELASDYPSLAQIGGHALTNIFLDSVSMDIERVDRVNELLAQTSRNGLKLESLRPISTFAVTPSQSLDVIAIRHLSQLPKATRALFRVLGVSAAKGSQRGGALISYLLFEAAYTRELIDLGRADCLSRTEEVKSFFKEARE